jgi:hypothetical protein
VHHEEDEVPREKSPRELVDALSRYLLDNPLLSTRIRELSLNFYWIFTTSSLLAPPFEDGESAKLQFMYLH